MVRRTTITTGEFMKLLTVRERYTPAGHRMSSTKFVFHLQVIECFPVNFAIGIGCHNTAARLLFTAVLHVVVQA